MRQPRSSQQFQFHWPPFLGFFIGLFFTILGITLLTGVIDFGLFNIRQVRWIVGLSVMLLGILRLIQFYPMLKHQNSRKSLREQVEELEHANHKK